MQYMHSVSHCRSTCCSYASYLQSRHCLYIILKSQRNGSNTKLPFTSNNFRSKASVKSSSHKQTKKSDGWNLISGNWGICFAFEYGYIKKRGWGAWTDIVRVFTIIIYVYIELILKFCCYHTVNKIWRVFRYLKPIMKYRIIIWNFGLTAPITVE